MVNFIRVSAFREFDVWSANTIFVGYLTTREIVIIIILQYA